MFPLADTKSQINQIFFWVVRAGGEKKIWGARVKKKFMELEPVKLFYPLNAQHLL